MEKRLTQQGYTFELDPNQAQLTQLAKSVGCSRFVYNWGLAESIAAYETLGKRPKHSELKKQLVDLKKGDSPWLYEVSAHISQQALVDLERAFDRFFKGLKGDGPMSGYPKFKRKGERDAARFYEVTLENRHLRLPNVGRVRLKESCTERGFQGRVLSATVRKRADRWFVSLCVEQEREVVEPKPVGRLTDFVGVDLGLKAAAVIHDGKTTRVVEPQQALRKNLRKLRRFNRQLTRKQKGSANRAKAKLELARLHYRISCQRQDHIHQLTSSLARTKSVIVLEDLHVKGMQRNKHLALSISDAGFGELRRQLAYKSAWYGSTLIVADRFYPSSKLCSGCGTIKGALGLSERVYCCDVCGLVLDRDENAAINLRRLGLAQLPVDRREVTPAERKALASAFVAGVKPASLNQETSGSRPVGRPNTSRREERLAGAVTRWA
jgi:putative transposase